MGISALMVEMIMREHQYRPIRGDAVLVGRQTVYLTRNDFLDLLTRYGLTVPSDRRAEIGIDQSTIDRMAGHTQKELVSDTAIFKAIGVESIRALDVSPYERAEIIHDLNIPVPQELKGIADFIVDGSTLDNTFNAALTLKNYCDILKLGGRLLAWNAFSPHNTPYSILPPLTWLDYFVVNGFSDAKVYITISNQHPVEGPVNIFYLSLDEVQRRKREMARLVSPYHMTCLVFAEKGYNSTTGRIPIQQDYRSPADWEEYCRNLAVMQESSRPQLARSNSDLMFRDLSGGYIFVDQNFQLAW
jgi:hypothetical protein